MANAKTVDAVEVEVRIDASPETVYDFFVDPDLMTQWMGRSVELDPRPGGVYRTEINDEATAEGSYVELDRPRRIVLAWGWAGQEENGPGSSSLEVLLAADGDGTHLRLIHSGLPSAESAAKHEHGWSHYAERLRLAATGADPGPDPMAEPPAERD